MKKHKCFFPSARSVKAKAMAAAALVVVVTGAVGLYKLNSVDPGS